MLITHRIIFETVFSAIFFLASLSGGTEPSSPATASSAPEGPTNQTSPKTEGVWKIKSATMAGKAWPSSATELITLQLTVDNYVVTVGDKFDKGTCILDRKPSPNRMTIKGTEGPNAEKTFLAIFDFPDDSTMRVCYDLTGTAFPQSFTSTAENRLYSVTYVRQP